MHRMNDGNLASFHSFVYLNVIVDEKKYILKSGLIDGDVLQTY